jgi:hypothetical protein
MSQWLSIKYLFEPCLCDPATTAHCKLTFADLVKFGQMYVDVFHCVGSLILEKMFQIIWNSGSTIVRRYLSNNKFREQICDRALGTIHSKSGDASIELPLCRRNVPNGTTLRSGYRNLPVCC